MKPQGLKPSKGKEVNRTTAQITYGAAPKLTNFAERGSARALYNTPNTGLKPRMPPHTQSTPGPFAGLEGLSPTRIKESPTYKKDCIELISTAPTIPLAKKDNSLVAVLQQWDKARAPNKPKPGVGERLTQSRKSANPLMKPNLTVCRETSSKDPSRTQDSNAIPLMDFFSQQRRPNVHVSQTEPSLGETGRKASCGLSLGLSTTKTMERESLPVKSVNPITNFQERVSLRPDSQPTIRDLPFDRSAQNKTVEFDRHKMGDKLTPTNRTAGANPKPDMNRSILKVCFSELASAADRKDESSIKFSIKNIESARSTELIQEFINVLDSKGLALVHYAIKLQNEDLFYFLLAKGADYDLPDESGITPMMYLALNPWPEVNNTLVNTIKAPNSVDQNGNNVFHYAVLKKNIELITYLLETKEGLCVRQKNTDGNTPTDLAGEEMLVKVESMFKKYERRLANGQSTITSVCSKDTCLSSKNIELPMSPDENSPFIHIKDATPRESPDTDDQMDDPPDQTITRMASINTPVKAPFRLPLDGDYGGRPEPKRGTSASASKQKQPKPSLNQLDEYGMSKHGPFVKKRAPDDNMSGALSNRSIQMPSKPSSVTDKATRTVRNLPDYVESQSREKLTLSGLPTLTLGSRPSMGNLVSKTPKDFPSLTKTKTIGRTPADDSSRQAKLGFPPKPVPVVNRVFKPVALSSKRPAPKPQPKIDISDFIIHSIIGEGSFGKVYLVQKRDSLAFYAMKTLSKEKVLSGNLERYAQTERNVLRQIDHPFIVKLRYSFQNTDYLFLIMDFMPGGDLGFYLERDGKFSERRARIYAAEIILAIAELHRHHIIFRDLKPDNILLDEEGHVLLSDFGLSKEGVRAANNEKSFCGTFAYLAPEMVKKSGHGKAMDWYLVGAFIFEMVTGIPPFYSDDKSELFHNIKSAELEFPDSISPELQDLLSKLLEKDPKKRIDDRNIKGHPWFKDVNWKEVLERGLKPPRPHIERKRLNDIDNPDQLFGGSRVARFSVENWTFIEDQPSTR